MAFKSCVPVKVGHLVAGSQVRLSHVIWPAAHVPTVLQPCTHSHCEAQANPCPAVLIRFRLVTAFLPASSTGRSVSLSRILMASRRLWACLLPHKASPQTLRPTLLSYCASGTSCSTFGAKPEQQETASMLVHMSSSQLQASIKVPVPVLTSCC